MTFTLSLPQYKETPISTHAIGKFHFRFGYKPSEESRNFNENGQDFLWLQVNDDRFVFVLCDGVGQSFLGDLAAKILGENLGAWLSTLQLNQRRDAIVELLNKKLYSIATEANQQIQNMGIPNDLPPMTKSALDSIRIEIGSESKFVAGVIDTQAEKAFFAWMGNSRFRIWNKNSTFGKFNSKLLNSKERWSTKSGPIGKVNHYYMDSLDMSHFTVYSDGLSALDEYPTMQRLHLSHDALNNLLMYDKETKDDKCFLEIWFSETSPEKENDERPTPMAAPMPRIGRILGLVLTTLLIIAALIIFSIFLLNIPSTTLPIAVLSQPIVLSPFWQGIITFLKGIAIAILFTIIPFWAAKITKYKSRISQSITEILMFSIVLAVVAFFMFKLQGDNTWMMFAIAIAAILDGGGHLLDYLRENQIDQIRREISSKQKSLRTKMKSSRKAARLEKDINQYQVMQEYLLRFDQIFQRERILYVSLPAGILLGTIFGIYKDATVYEYLEYSIVFVSLFATLILTYFVLKSLKDMTSPVYAGEYIPNETMPSDSTDLEKFREEKESVLGFAKTTTDIRSMYLYDSAHNIFLLTGFAYIFSSSVGNDLPLKIVVLIVLLSLTFLNSLPFAIGQSRLREGILKKYAGYANAVMKSELKKDEFAPLVIKPEFFTSVFTVGAGGLLLTMAVNFVTELFK